MPARGPSSAPHKKCLGCAYILDHLPENRCPECGRAFDPEDPATFTVGRYRSGTSLLTWACIGSLLLLFPFIYVISFYTLGVDLNSAAFVESPIISLLSCGFPVGFVIDAIVALAVSRARRRGRRSRSLTVAGWVAAGSLTVFSLFMILGSLIEWIANRW